ncbi:spore germination protein [Pseudalkalibacillus hwajinpoensis]|uniref:Spore germination protein n=1 Tax=Guptibacillus hwajinpoensis TaxID=208199 RepID=A0A4U1MHW1_9BACL|nr:spore germination protein [Pseudalkalibacillus hwajinpoensis]TKD69910.1 spore germination protein [Pseudalkalibacillus hwajinpoensis]
MTSKINNKQKIFKKIKENEEFLSKSIGIGKSFDVGVRKLKILNKEVQFYYCTGLCDTSIIVEIMRELMFIDDHHRLTIKLEQVIHNHLPHQQVTVVETFDEVVDQVLSGLIAVFMEGEEQAFIIDVRKYPGRTPQEPDTEKVIRGSRDGYTENIIENTALTRRRIRDGRLRNEILQIGERSKTDVCITYIQDVANPNLIEIIKKKLEEINIDGIPMADKTVEEFLVHQAANPFPLVRYTERPDVAASHLLEGHVLIIVDTSPSVIITPTTFFHHVQHAEEYREAPLPGAFLRWVRFGGMLAALLLLPLWLLMVDQPELLPKTIDFIGPNDKSNVPIFLQIILAEIGIETLRMAAIHTPTPLSTAMGLIAAVLIGQIAIDVGLFVPEVILYVSIAAVGSFATPSYELAIANKLIRLVLLFLVFFFGVPGYIIGVTAVILFLVSLKPLNTPYMWPFIPFNPKAFIQVLIRVSVPLTKLRPSITEPQNKNKQPDKPLAES